MPLAHFLIVSSDDAKILGYTEVHFLAKILQNCTQMYAILVLYRTTFKVIFV